MLRLYRLAILALLSVFISDAAAQKGQETGLGELELRVAKYHFEMKNYPAARTTLLRQSDLNYHQQLLLARVLVEEKSYHQAQQVFAQVELGKAPDIAQNAALLSLAHLYYAQSMCDEAIKTLDGTKKLDAEQEAFSLFLRVTCMLQLDKSAKQIKRAEKLLENSIRPGMEVNTYIWLSYAYYNLASAAANTRAYDAADELFKQALHYTGEEAEGLALAEKIRLSRAKVRYLDNRFDYAMETYEELPLDTYWQDEVLLGYGWAAFKNYQADRALEAWWQLTNLPYKSINVYQAYLLIPFAYERANAYNQALSGYDWAIEQYGNVLSELERFQQYLTAERIHQHAVHYYLSSQYVEPIHPLLAVTYTKPEFRMAVEQVGKLTSYQERLTQYQYFLEQQQLYRTQFAEQAEVRQLWRQQQVQSIKQRLQQLDHEVQQWLDDLLLEEVGKEGVSSKLKALHQRYRELKQKSYSETLSPELEARLRRLQGVLLNRLVEQKNNHEFTQKLANISRWQQRLRVRFAEYLELSKQEFRQEVSDNDIEIMQQRIAEQLHEVEAVLEQVLTQLLDKTQLALLEQQELIAHYERQARVARTNLREEFYQRGGSKLWY